MHILFAGGVFRVSPYCWISFLPYLAHNDYNIYIALYIFLFLVKTQGEINENAFSAGSR